MAGLMNESDEEINELNQLLDDEIGSFNNFTLNGKFYVFQVSCIFGCINALITNTMEKLFV